MKVIIKSNVKNLKGCFSKDLNKAVEFPFTIDVDEKRLAELKKNKSIKVEKVQSNKEIKEAEEKAKKIKKQAEDKAKLEAELKAKKDEK